jgi:hypothetical protein
MTAPGCCVTRGFAYRIAKLDLMLIIGRAKEGRAATISVVAAKASLKAISVALLRRQKVRSSNLLGRASSVQKLGAPNQCIQFGHVACDDGPVVLP